MISLGLGSRRPGFHLRLAIVGDLRWKLGISALSLQKLWPLGENRCWAKQWAEESTVLEHPPHWAEQQRELRP